MALSVTISDKNYTISEFLSLNEEDMPKWAISSQQFLKEWFAGGTEFKQLTSGSTGKAKAIFIDKIQMEISAKNTIAALKIPKNANVLHCISAEYIGGKMMWVRAILSEWNVHLIKPKGLLPEMKLWSHYDFAAMVPLQIKKTLAEENGQSIMNRFEQVIIGGAAVSEGLIATLQGIKATCFSTFGMTETVSHIALRQLNGEKKSSSFRVIGDNQISINAKGCLMIKGGVTHDEWLETNDLVKIKKSGFEWIGRYDLVVNTGGIKVSLEEAESTLKINISAENHHFFFWKESDEGLGEKLIGISDSKIFINYLKENHKELSKKLPKYHFPIRWYLVNEIIYTQSEKIDRIQTADHLLDQFNF